MSPAGDRSTGDEDRTTVPGTSVRSGRAAGMWINVGLALLSGVWVLAFSPHPQAIAALPGFVAVLALIERVRTTKAAVLWIVAFGAVGIGFGYRWLAQTVRDFGELDEQVGPLAVPVSWLILAVYGVAGTVHGILFAVLYRWMRRPDRRPHPLATVTLFVACESLPIRFLPWMAGYGAVEVAPLRQAAEWGGVHAVSFALLCLVVPFHEWLRWVGYSFQERFSHSEGGAGAYPPARPGAAAVTFAVGAAIYGVGLVRLHQVAAQERDAPRTVRIGIVQANVGSKAKRAVENERVEEARRNREAYKAGSRGAADRDAELIVWPETAMVEGLPLWNSVGGRFLPPDAISRGLAAHGYGFVDEVGQGRAMLIGGYEDELGPLDAKTGRREEVRYNAAMLRQDDGKSWDLYRKVRLIPFGETMPGSSLFPGLAKMLPQARKMTAGDLPQPPLVWRRKDGDVRIVSFICYEAILPNLVSDLCEGTHPDLLVNLTNDSWYGDTWEPHQHLNFSRFRAVEHRAPLVRSTNTGISAFIDPTGEVVTRLGYEKQGVLVLDVPLVPRGRTPWEVLSGAIRWLLLAAGALVVVLARWDIGSRNDSPTSVR